MASRTLFTFLLCCTLSRAAFARNSFDARGAHLARLVKRNTTSTPASECPSTLTKAILSIPAVGGKGVSGDVNPVTGDVLDWIALGVGSVQYNCTDTKAWRTAGSRGSLYDASCMYSSTSADFLSLTTDALALLPGKSQTVLETTLNSLTGKVMPTLGTFYLHDAAQKFDMRQRRGGPYSDEGEDGYIVTVLDAEQNAPIFSFDAPWEKMNGTIGNLSDSVFRVSTSGGVPANPICTPGDTTSIPFAAQFWFYSTANTTSVVAGEVASTTNSTLVKACDVAIPSSNTTRVMSTFLTSVIYGDSTEDCTSTTDCSTKCMADSDCEGYILSTEDGIGHTKVAVNSNEVIYATGFTSGIVRDINGTQYIDRFGNVENCPDGQITSPLSTACAAPLCLD